MSSADQTNTKQFNEEQSNSKITVSSEIEADAMQKTKLTPNDSVPEHVASIPTAEAEVLNVNELTLDHTGREVFKPLDGGWGWAIVFGCLLVHICMAGIHKR